MTPSPVIFLLWTLLFFTDFLSVSKLPFAVFLLAIARTLQGNIFWSCATLFCSTYNVTFFGFFSDFMVVFVILTFPVITIFLTFFVLANILSPSFLGCKIVIFLALHPSRLCDWMFFTFDIVRFLTERAFASEFCAIQLTLEPLIVIFSPFPSVDASSKTPPAIIGLKSVLQAFFHAVPLKAFFPTLKLAGVFANVTFCKLLHPSNALVPSSLHAFGI